MTEQENGLLAGRVALVTGASRGIGRAIALALAREGARVAVNAHHSAAQAEGVVEEIARAGGRAALAVADVADTAAVERMVAEVQGALGPIDILVNNAGAGKVTTLEEMSPEEWDWMVDVNLKSLYNTCRAVLGGMKARRYGKILCISSLAGVRGSLVG
ncbi:MAG: SDR family NAD(P)-dependent oxidoreductase, partial [Chloroflexi bacterium]|nr:SDR family NAD(P)-dependent oxidoreductase [Chloroflexota bacterium]